MPDLYYLTHGTIPLTLLVVSSNRMPEKLYDIAYFSCAIF
jgi:hypothetical protein